MNGLELLEKMELIEPAYVEKADAPPVRRYRVRGVWAAAACVCLLLGAVLWPKGGTTITPDPQVSGFELSEGTTAKVTVGIDAYGNGGEEEQLFYYSEEEMFALERMYVFRGKVAGLTNITIDFNGIKVPRCVATVVIDRVYQGDLLDGDQIRMLLPCSAGMPYTDDHTTAAMIDSGMEGIFMPRIYDGESVWQQNEATLMMEDLAACGLADGLRWAFLDTEEGLVYEQTAYPGAAGATTLDDVEEYVLKMLG